MTNSNNSFKTESTISTAEGDVTIFSLKKLQEVGYKQIETLPYSIKVLLENVLRNEDGSIITAKDIIEKSEIAVRGNTSHSLYEITIKTRRWTRTLKTEVYESRKEKKSFSVILAPKKDAGNRFLLINQRQK